MVKKGCVVVLLLLAGCAATAEVKSNCGEEALTVCPEPRPQMCTMDYRPVCAELKDGSRKTFSNGCTACSNPAVVGYRDGECAAAN